MYGEEETEEDKGFFKILVTSPKLLKWDKINLYKEYIVCAEIFCSQVRSVFFS